MDTCSNCFAPLDSNRTSYVLDDLTICFECGNDLTKRGNNMDEAKIVGATVGEMDEFKNILQEIGFEEYSHLEWCWQGMKDPSRFVLLSYDKDKDQVTAQFGTENEQVYVSFAIAKKVFAEWATESAIIADEVHNMVD